MLTDFLSVRRGLPDISRIFEFGLVFFPTAVARYRADRYAVAFWPAVRVVGAIRVEGIIYRQIPELAMVGQCVVGMPVSVAFTPYLDTRYFVRCSDPWTKPLLQVDGCR